MHSMWSSNRCAHLLLAITSITLLSYSIFYFSAPLPAFIFPQLPPPEGIRIPINAASSKTLPPANKSSNHLSPPPQYFYKWEKGSRQRWFNGSRVWSQPILDPNYAILWTCPFKPNKYTGHIRLPNIIQNVSQIPPHPVSSETRRFWNPTVVALPYWSKSRYLLVSRVLTNGNHQQSVICEADFCHGGEGGRDGERVCQEDDKKLLGDSGGLRCAKPPILIDIPPTPAKHCEGKFGTYIGIPGFHDPRIFYGGRGEILMVVNTQSRYACFGLWLIDLRSVYEPLQSLLSSSPTRLSLGPLKSYAYLTEITRNPPETRAPIEKNWFLFFAASGESFVHYDISNPRNSSSKGRTFAKLIGGGLTTTNLTDPHEAPCIQDLKTEEPDEMKRSGVWHQATNSLRLVLCYRRDKHCKPNRYNTVFFAIIHRKHSNYLKLPLRYERYVMVWSARAPYSMLGISKHPILMANETASGWDMWQNWDDDAENAAIVANHTATHGDESKDPHGGKEYWAYFTYTVSIAWAWRKDVEVEGLGEGYLDDEVLLSIGVDDDGDGVARVRAEDLVRCLRACPGKRM